MDRIAITGGTPLKGEIAIAGAKNSALKLMVASLLTDQPLELENVPAVADVTALVRILEELGVVATAQAGCMRLDAGSIASTVAPYDLVRKMRASVLVLGPLLARCRQARVSLPGGCAIGTRPVDLHIHGLEALGAEIVLDQGYLVGHARGGLVGADIRFPQVSVGATEHVMMAATLARGVTVLRNVAREPEIVDLARCLVAMGARIEGAGGEAIRIEGVERLGGARHRVIPDRIETGTYIMAAAATDGELELLDTSLDHLGAAVDALERSGVAVEATNRGIRVRRANGRLAAVDAATAPYPGFPTDLQAQMMALMTTARGESHLEENIFENRFMHVPELMRMGADIQVHGGSAIVNGVARLRGAPVMATDLRASVCLVLAGLIAEGETVVNRVYHLDRGYERLVEKLGACGALIERQSGSA
ncbi:MAG: UDP-N-acetylglucosamine 1-carboxyvinyltransferase [Proteobacteria bacterium]|nr:UDP-N-acetylglucosamine 1-carboxyvinyltransferase [Pseudomonadota bacterium]MDA1072269.1 UDP-N-acetylglucosamine 1-carboxyvinyltransferase [Pseudomonadota bacterium]